MMTRSAFFFLVLLGVAHASYSQLITIPINREESIAASGRVSDVQSLTLPFWDDFSDSPGSFPKADLWLYAKSAWVNSGMGINPPSINVATLDGLDSVGKPYNVNDILAKGFADKMVSQVIRLNEVDVAQRSTVFLSFFFQFQGNGEAPDAGDILALSLRTVTGTWERVWFAENDGSLSKDVFTQILIPINADRFFHDKFQFRFQNISRLSGPYDTWNIDYIYLNKGRSSFDNSYPDRAITAPLSNFFNLYSTIPIKHFFHNPATAFSNPSFSIYNLRIGNNQPLNYFSTAEVKTFFQKTEVSTTTKLDEAQDIGSLIGLQRKTAKLTTLPALTLFDPKADSIQVKIGLLLTTKDNSLEGPPENGDYNPAKYSPIDFRKNDVLTASFSLTNSYAYDDGSAEYGAGLNQPGAQLAYEYNMITAQSDTIVALDVYFPRFGDETSQVIQLHIWKDLAGAAGTVLHLQPWTVSRSSQNKFVRISLNNFIGVKGSFFVGWKQSSAAIIAAGLDKSSNSGAKMYFNTNGAWEKNTTVAGSLMIRPVFGKGRGVIVGLEEAEKTFLYPNPCQGIFYIPKEASQIIVVDMRGASQTFEENTAAESKQISLTNPTSGLYLVRFQLANRSFNKKIMVLTP